MPGGTPKPYLGSSPRPQADGRSSSLGEKRHGAPVSKDNRRKPHAAPSAPAAAAPQVLGHWGWLCPASRSPLLPALQLTFGSAVRHEDNHCEKHHGRHHHRGHDPSPPAGAGALKEKRVR